MSKVKLLLLNLPIPDFIKDFQRGNSRIYSFYIESIILNKNINNIEIVRLSRKIIETYNDNAIVKEIINLKPDIVGFSSYLWNIDRNINISLKLKEFGIITITGGPEISMQNEYLIKNGYFNYYIENEGEYLLIDLINKIINKTHINNFISNNSNIDFNDFIFKYTQISDDYKTDRLFYLEIERGCPFKCNYCAYNKFRNKITSIDFEIFKNCITEIYKKNIEEIYLLAPTLNRDKKRFARILDYIINLRKKTGKKIKLFGEIRAELINDDEDIKLMKNAGFTDIEFGLQTFNIKSYKKLNRTQINFNPIEFSKKLLDNGITPLIDFMIGLPHDNCSSIIEAIDLIDKNGLLEYSNFYHLHVLANTELRNIFNKYNFIYGKKSPYLSYQVDTLDFSDITKIYYYIENKKNYSFNMDFFDYNENNFIVIKRDSDFSLLINSPYYNLASFLTIDNFSTFFIIDFFKKYLGDNKEIFFKLFLYSKKEIDINFLNTLNDFFINNRNYYDLYREGLNYSGNRVFSKNMHILLNINIDKKIFDKYNDKFLVDFILFPEDLNNKTFDAALAEKYYKEYGVYTYLFKDNTGIEGEYIRRLPFSFII